MSESPVKNEATGVETVDFQHFGKTWTVPAKQRLSHMRVLRYNPTNLGMIEAYLDEKQNAALDEINPTAEELDAFTDAIAAAMGFKTSGNS